MRTGSSTQTVSHFLQNWRGPFHILSVKHVRNVSFSRSWFWIFETRQNKFLLFGINLSGSFGIGIFTWVGIAKYFLWLNSCLTPDYRAAHVAQALQTRGISERSSSSFGNFCKEEQKHPFPKVYFYRRDKRKFHHRRLCYVLNVRGFNSSGARRLCWTDRCAPRQIMETLWVFKE